MLRHKRLRKKGWWLRITRPLFDRQLWKPCRDTVATGLAIGFFFSMMFLPFQMIAAAILAMRLRANVPFAIAGCWVSNLLTHIPIWIAQEWLGDWMRETLGIKLLGFENLETELMGKLEVNVASFILGMFTSGILLVLAAYPLVHLFSKFMPHLLPVLKSRPVKMRKGEA
tara:strand:- start:16075 stop:16584 length:510 start_codon:yes stop_codon:yes gene_type:complete